jgi:hypothetical protein
MKWLALLSVFFVAGCARHTQFRVYPSLHNFEHREKPEATDYYLFLHAEWKW